MIKIMLDKSPKQIAECSARYNHEFWQLRTPLTKYRIGETPYGLDNGCFSAFYEKRWNRLLDDAQEVKPVFVCLPDIVGDAMRTLELFDQFMPITAGLPRALVLQDGIGNHRIPWSDLDAVFVGGSDAFKLSPEAINACKTARMLGKWVHVGRVNSVKRVRNWTGLAHSIDGSGISKIDYRLEDVLSAVRGEHKQAELFN